MTPLNFVIAALSVFSIVIISASYFKELDPEVISLLEYFDILLCVFFFGDFLKQLFTAENKWRYMYTYGWIDLVSSIPVINEFRYARAMRIFRVIRVVKSSKLLWEFLKKNKKKTLYATVILALILSIITSTTLVLYFEKDVGNIQTAEDALWWTFITITTVGYGDFYPVTNMGKLISSFLILNGLVGFGALVSYINDMLSSLDSKSE